MARFLSEKDVLLGSTLLGRYAVAGRIASGGVSDVYLARQPSMGNRSLAIKVLKKVICQADSPESEVHRKRFSLEAELLSMLRGSCFACIIDAGTLEDAVPRPFVVMEYFQGSTLAEHVSAGRRFSLAQASGMTLMLAEALQELHGYKVVYRDLSPGNVILEETEGQPWPAPRLFDFSHAIMEGIEQLDGNGVAGQLLAGTPPYAAPELTSGTGDLRSDVFSLAGVFYAMLAGLPPLGLRSPSWPDYVTAVSKGRCLPEQSLAKLGLKVPRRLDDLLRKSLASKPDDRTASIRDFVAELCDVLLKTPDVIRASEPSLLSVLTRILLGR